MNISHSNNMQRSVANLSVGFPETLAPHSLRIEALDNPIGIGANSPRLSWKLPPAEGVQQVAFQIVAASSEKALHDSPDIFDTGRYDSSQSVFVSWPGEALLSRSRIFWKVRSWISGAARPTSWSKPAVFEVGLLERSDWKAKWISWGNDGKEGSPPAPYLRKEFELQSKPVSARLYASAFGLFEFEINGQAVHPEAVLVPGWTDFRKRAQSLTFDVTKLLFAGPNAIGCILGDGWYGGHLGFKDNRQIYGNSPAIIAQLEVTFEGGKTFRLVSDKTWIGRTGPIIESDLYNGEIYDARSQIFGWSQPGLKEGGWSHVRTRRIQNGYHIEPKILEPVKRIQEIRPKKILEPECGVYIFDLGQNVVGWVRIKLEGKRGQVITLRFGEMLNDDGTLYTANLRSAKATDTYIFGENGIIEWEPRFTFHGFRYVELTGVRVAPKKKMITGIVLHNNMLPTGNFECSDPRVNQLASNIRWGLRGNFLEVPTDCPQRDERLGWAGDIQVFAKTASFLYDVDAFLTKWMRDMRDGQTAEGAFPDIAPTFICGFGNAAWADAGVIVPWVMYRRYGDIRILEENYQAMSKWISYQEKTSVGLVRPITAYGDWLAIDAVIPEHAPVPSDLIGTAYFARTAGIMGSVAKILSRNDDAQRFAKLRNDVVQAFQNEFVTANGRLVGDCQTAYLLALAFDMLQESERSAAVERLVELIRRRNWHLSTGFVGTPLLCPVLSRFGRHDVAMKLLLQDSYPSWLFTVKNGATTMWERWNSYTPEKGFGDVIMNSFNHYAYGAVGEWLFHFVAGIAPGPKAPAYRHILFRPQPSQGISSASASLETPYGLAAISWKSQRKKLTGKLTIPSNTFADLECPTSGIITPQGRKKFSLESGTNRLHPGHYNFSMTSH